MEVLAGDGETVHLGFRGARVRLWKVELQKLADETGLILNVHHYPPGTSKWNKIEHRLFCHITQNWRGRPLIDHVTIAKTARNVAVIVRNLLSFGFRGWCSPAASKAATPPSPNSPMRRSVSCAKTFRAIGRQCAIPSPTTFASSEPAIFG
jgi:Rhodopirellula transposase DDE domain